MLHIADFPFPEDYSSQPPALLRVLGWTGAAGVLPSVAMLADASLVVLPSVARGLSLEYCVQHTMAIPCTIEYGNLLYNTQWKKTCEFRKFYKQHTMGIYSKTHLNDTIFWEAEKWCDLAKV